MTWWLRVEAGGTVGLGHLMRVVALAEELGVRGLDARFVVDGDERARELAARFAPAAPAGEAGAPGGGDVLVLDGYGYGPDAVAAGRAAGATVVAMHDHGPDVLPADVVVNQNLVDRDLAGRLEHALPPGATLLLGPRHALVRRSFRAVARDRDEPGPLLVTLGGSDAPRRTRRVLDLVRGRAPLPGVVLLLGPHASLPGPVPSDVEVVRSPPSVAAVADRCAAALCAAGTTTWELLCAGLPTVVVQTEPNQVHVARPVAATGAALLLDEDADPTARVLDRLADAAERATLSRAGRRLVDGRGAARVVDAVLGRLS